MARRKSKKSPRRKTQKAVNLTDLAQSYVLADAVTMGLFDNNPVEFITGRLGGNFRPGADGGQNISMPELLGFDRNMNWSLSRVGGEWSTGSNYTMSTAIRRNLSVNGMRSIGTLIVAPPAFKFVKKAASKPRNMVNRFMRDFGIPVRV
jgi:hypothetical protein